MTALAPKRVYYNEFDPSAAVWLRQLVADGLIADGVVDDRSIVDVQAVELVGYGRLHFFAGIAGWELALQLAGWPEDRPVWTASLPCQPFSVAGKGLGKADERHLLPHFLELVRGVKPGVIFGEQVPGAIKHGWADDLCDHLEREGYTVRAAVLSAAGAGQAHIRQRLYWCAQRTGSVRLADPNGEQADPANTGGFYPELGGGGGLAYSDGTGLPEQPDERRIPAETPGDDAGQDIDGSGGLDQPESERRPVFDPQDIRQADGESYPFADPGDSAHVEPPRLHVAAVGRLGNAEHDGRVAGALTGSDVQASAERRQDGQDISGESAGTGGRGDAGGLPAGVDGCEGGGLGDPERHGHNAREIGRSPGEGEAEGGLLEPERPSADWDANDIDWLYCRDGKYRPIQRGLKPLVRKFEPGVKPLADGIPAGMVRGGDQGAPEDEINPEETGEARIMRLKGYGNAIQVDTAVLFIKAFLGDL